MTRALPLPAPSLTSLPSRKTGSPAPARSPSLATWPRTVTRPALIQVSISRREPKPAAASSFCSRSPAGLLGAGGWGGRFVGGGLGGRGLKLQRPGDFLQRRQFLQRTQAEVVEERPGGGVQRRPAGRVAVADHVDP